MSAFLGISLWITLATVVPGLITVAAICGGFAFIAPELFRESMAHLKDLNEWLCAGFAVTLMILTQAFGILLESLLVRKRWLGSTGKIVKIPEGIDPHGLTEFTLSPYVEYQGLYLLLAELRENEDSQGHLQRALAQFFLTNNTLVSFGAGIVVAVLVMAYSSEANPARGFLYLGTLGIFMIVTYRVAVIRFEVMGKALWAARRRRMGDKDRKKEYINRDAA